MKNHKNYFLLTFIILLCLSVFTLPVNAETLTGVIGGAEAWNSTLYTVANEGGTTAPFSYIYTPNAQYISNLKTIVLFPVAIMSIDSGAPAGNQTSFRIFTGARERGNGTIGYQRLFNSGGTEIIGGSFYLSFDNFDNEGLTGVTNYQIVYDTAALYHISPIRTTSGSSGISDGQLAIKTTTGNFFASGNYIKNTDFSIINDYIAIKPAGLGIAGYIYKNTGNSSTYYPTRAYVFNATSDAVLANENTVNSNLFYFNVIANTVKLGVIDANNVWHNTSVLFSSIPATPTPTPTPIGWTPTPTPNPTTSTNITLTFKDNTNHTALSGVYVELYSSDGLSSHQGYTDSNGIFESDLNYAGSHEVRSWKSGYQYHSEVITATQYTYATSIYLHPELGTPSIPATINITLTIRDSNGGAPLQNVAVTVNDGLGYTSTSAQYTDANGLVRFYHFPNTAYIGGQLMKNGYNTRYWDIEYQPMADYANTFYMAGGNNGNPTPTPTPIQYDTWTLQATEPSVNLGDEVVLTADCSNISKEDELGGLRTVLYYENNNLGGGSQFKLIGVYNYNLTSTYWNFRPNNSAIWDVTTATYNPTEMHTTPTTSGTHTYQMATFGVNQISYGVAVCDVLVAGGASQGSLTMKINANDAQTTNHLQNYQLTLTNDLDGVPHVYTVAYDLDINLLRGQSYTLDAVKSGYEDATASFIVPIDMNVNQGDVGAIYTIPMFPSGYISAGNCTVTVNVKDIETYYPLANVVISLTGQAQKTTGTGGESASFIVPQNTAFIVAANKEGYCGVSESKNTSTLTYMYVPLYIKFGACSGVTPTHTPIGGTPTPTPTITPIGGYGVQNGTAAVCRNPMPANSTYIDVLKNQMACNGITDLTGQNLALAMLIMLFAGMILGKVAKGIGVLAGVIAGAVISMVMGFLPFWIIIVLIVLAGLVFAGKVFWSTGA
jgi:hypothetical protein